MVTFYKTKLYSGFILVVLPSIDLRINVEGKKHSVLANTGGLLVVSVDYILAIKHQKNVLWLPCIKETSFSPFSNMGFYVASRRNSANPTIRLALAAGGCVSLCDEPTPGDLTWLY